jgi:hypothetical protein
MGNDFSTEPKYNAVTNKIIHDTGIQILSQKVEKTNEHILNILYPYEYLTTLDPNALLNKQMLTTQPEK